VSLRVGNCVLVVGRLRTHESCPWRCRPSTCAL
jgi:hypothetical protein